MKDKTNKQQQSPLMVEDKAKEKIKKRAQDQGLIVNAGVSKAPQQPVKKEGTSK
jgi:hypothetical protein